MNQSDKDLIDSARAHGYEYPSVPCGECGEPTYLLPGEPGSQESGHYAYHDHRSMLETLNEWYGNGDMGEEQASDGMGNGACLYNINGELWVFQWDDAGIEDCGQVTREEWDRIAATYEGEED